MFDNYELSHYYEACMPRVEVLYRTRKKRKKQKTLIKRIKCEQPWTSIYATSNAKAMFHQKECLSLGLVTNVTI